ncbi:MAG TPA: type II secretion system F family protein [Planctomycetota bacterium]|nr:type II secretion system F family protein [Planctomycetota bacterium]
MSRARSEAYRGLSSMLKAGVPIMKSVRTATPRRPARLRRGFQALAEGAADGDALAETMAKHPAVFPPLDVRLVDVAEKSGRLPETLDLLAEHYAFRDRIRRVIVSGLLLPVVLVHIAALVAPLPPWVLGNIGTGRYLWEAAKILSLLYIPGAVILGVIVFTPKTGPLRSVLDHVTLWVPVLGRAVRQLSLSRFAGTFRMLYETGGIPMPECVGDAAELSGNAVVRRWVIGGVASARDGRPASEGFSSRLPRGFNEAWLIGEESGKLDETAERLARSAAEDAEHLFTEFGRWLPRVIYFLVMILLVVLIVRQFSAVAGVWNELPE